MENRINQIMTLEDGLKYIVIKQAIYKGENYYVVCGILEDEETLKDEFKVLHELEYENDKCVEEVTDPATFKLICDYLKIGEKEDWNEE